MAIPPPPPVPPPPGPPPPPTGFLLGGISKASSSSGGDNRSALFQSIQKGAKLKKTVTNDKSGPLISGKVTSNNGTSGGSGVSAPSRPPPPSSIGNNSNVTNGMPKLGGIFEGMSTMPKLKPVGGRGATTTNRTSPESPAPSDNTSNSYNNSNGPALDFNAELTKHLTLKKQKKQQQQQQLQQQPNATEANLRTNRGPPPQPPNKGPTNERELAVNTTSSNLSKQQQKSQNNSTNNSISSVTATPPPPPPANGINLAPNKSSLFAKSANNLDSSSSSTSSGTNITPNMVTNNGSGNGTTATAKPVPNHGKPNCAPKPPGIQQIIAAKNGVSRHHSMRSPRSPPIMTSGPVFPAVQHFGTMRGPPQMFQSQDSINTTSSTQPTSGAQITTTRQAPNPPIARPTVAPPRPPNIKPPPPPIRSVSNTNLTTLPLSVAPSSASAGVNTSFGSASNVSTLKEQFSINKPQIGGANSVNNVSTLHNNLNSNNSSTILSSLSSPSAAATTNATSNFNSNNSNSHGSSNNVSPATKDRSNGNAPPLPPHRTCPAPPPPIRQTSTTPSTNVGAPPVPQRHSSMRNSNSNIPAGGNFNNTHQSSQQQQQQHQQYNQTTGSRSSNRVIIDLEAKFSHLFHNVTEFPPPPPFTNLPKSYQSTKATTVENKKAKAPSPPVNKDKYYLQLGDEKICSNDTSLC